MRAKPRSQSEKSDTVETDVLEDYEQANQPTRKQRMANIRDLRLRKLEADAALSAMKTETEIQKLQSQTGGGAAGGTGAASPAAGLIVMLAAQGLEPTKANEYIKALDNESIMKLSMIGARDSNALLPLILLGSKQGTSLEDIVKVVGAIIAIAKPPQGNDAMMTKLVTETIPNMYQRVAEAKDVAYSSQIAMLRQELADNKPKNPMEYVKDVAEAAAALGMRPGADVSLEVKKLELEDAREVRRITADKENTQMIVGTAKEMMEGKLGELIGRIGDAGVEKIRNNKGAQVPTSTQAANTFMVQCGSCGGTFPVGADAKTVDCPHCGAKDLKIQMPTQRSEEPAQDRVPSFDRGGGELKPLWSTGPSENEQ